MRERITLPDREVILVGTAHVSPDSVDDVRAAIAEEDPDRVCVELDQQRYEALTGADAWRDLDVYEAISGGKGWLLLVQVVLSIYQRRIGATFETEPGAEMLAAIEAAEEDDIPYSLVDRDINQTLRDAVRSLTLREKLRLAWMLVAAYAGPDEADVDVTELTEQDVLDALVTELGEQFPSLAEQVLEKRDRYMADRIRDAAGETVVAVVGAAHVDGIARHLRADEIAPVEPVPGRRVSLGAVARYGVPALIVGLFAYILAVQGAAVAGRAFGVWAALNAVGAATGAAAARARVQTVVASAVAAPFTSINPALPAGLVGAWVEHRVDPPTVADLEAIGAVDSYRAFWSNTALNLVLVFVLVNMGSAVATYLGGGFLARLVLG